VPSTGAIRNLLALSLLAPRRVSVDIYTRSRNTPSNLRAMPPPRPCLKAQLGSESDPLPFASRPKGLLSPHVHFPPTPALTSTHFADSPRTYDRAPITISPNLCALPERGGRMYSPTSESWNLAQGAGCYFQLKACETGTPDFSGAHIAATSPPLFIPDLSSEFDESSDESDGQVTTPDPSPMIPPIPTHFTDHTQLSPIPHARSQETINNALSFLPYPPELVKEKRRKRRNQSRSLLGVGASHRIKHIDAFAEPALDGCLGGF
jgi:hypothetical protein